jgi:hypothetical protein
MRSRSARHVPAAVTKATARGMALAVHGAGVMASSKHTSDARIAALLLASGLVAIGVGFVRERDPFRMTIQVEAALQAAVFAFILALLEGLPVRTALKVVSPIALIGALTVARHGFSVALVGTQVAQIALIALVRVGWSWAQSAQEPRNPFVRDARAVRAAAAPPMQDVRMQSPHTGRAS